MMLYFSLDVAAGQTIWLQNKATIRFPILTDNSYCGKSYVFFAMDAENDIQESSESNNWMHMSLETVIVCQNGINIYSILALSCLN